MGIQCRTARIAGAGAGRTKLNPACSGPHAQADPNCWDSREGGGGKEGSSVRTNAGGRDDRSDSCANRPFDSSARGLLEPSGKLDTSTSDLRMTTGRESSVSIVYLYLG
ncbi:hypothetical protein GY45DRAFT_86424 [Cubamyces sp. BRFM 1775]|nr:hypothetical protein GY45DRAFT_86424 [Cubamyces sp. BRFM 1775]